MDDNPYKPTVNVQHSPLSTRRFVCWIFVILMPIGTLYMAALAFMCLYLLFVPADGWAVDEVILNILFTLAGAAICVFVFMKAVSTLKSAEILTEQPELATDLFPVDVLSSEYDR